MSPAEIKRNKEKRSPEEREVGVEATGRRSFSRDINKERRKVFMTIEKVEKR